MNRERETFKATIISVQEKGMIVTCIMEYEGYPLDFGPQGRLHGRRPHFCLAHWVQGFRRRKRPENYTNFGQKGLRAGVKVKVYHMPGRPEFITYVVPA